MTAVLWAVITLLVVALVVLWIKIYLLRKGARQLREGLHLRLTEQTNTLLSLSTRDREMRRLADSLNQELRRLRHDRLGYQQGNRELKEEIANISHDLRTPLTAICGYLELLKEQPLSPDALRYLSHIENRTEAMKRLTEELFRYSLAASSQELELQPVELGRALEESLLAFYETFEKRGITPVVELPGQKVERLLDLEALRRILENILSNGLKYSAGDFTVTLTPQGTFTFSNLAPGLDPVAAGRLFDRFYTVEAARHSTGLGLAIAKLLTERMGGTIGAAYHDGRLTITLSFENNV